MKHADSFLVPSVSLIIYSTLNIFRDSTPAKKTTPGQEVDQNTLVMMANAMGMQMAQRNSAAAHPSLFGNGGMSGMPMMPGMPMSAPTQSGFLPGLGQSQQGGQPNNMPPFMYR